MKIRFHPEAVAEFEEAAKYYEQHQEGLGHRFITAIDSALRAIGEDPDQLPLFEPGIRRRLVRVFPYAVLYNKGAEFVLIIAIMHCHQEPLYWRKRIAN